MLQRLSLPRGFFRLSALVRAFWIFIAVLHLGIFFYKLADGGIQGVLTQVRLVLLIAASIYGGVRTWRPAEQLDGASPRRVIALLLLVFAGHCAVSSSAYAREVRESLASAEWGRIAAVAPLSIAVAAAGVAMFRLRATVAVALLGFFVTLRPAAFAVFSTRISPNLFSRPPPTA